MRRRDLLALGVIALSVRLPMRRPALAQSKYPDRPIRLVIPFPPGGGYDAVGRPWAEKMKSVLGSAPRRRGSLVEEDSTQTVVD
jgi:tripartite-type tricarboxylate transporter receptor subunit TctC